VSSAHYTTYCSAINVQLITLTYTTIHNTYASTTTHLVGEADSEAEEDAADDQHVYVDGGAVEDGADEEEGGADEHGGPPADLPGDVAGDQAREHAGEVERGDEGCQHLAVEDAVLVLLRVAHLLEDVREEGLQERRHLRQPTWKSTTPGDHASSNDKSAD
jgi:hypothetical protein